MVRTPGFHSGITGSNPVTTTIILKEEYETHQDRNYGQSILTPDTSISLGENQ